MPVTQLPLQLRWTTKQTGRSKIRFPQNLQIALYSALLVGTIVYGAVVAPSDKPFVDRLRTIISYDRICVLDAGQIAVSIINSRFIGQVY